MGKKNPTREEIIRKLKKLDDQSNKPVGISALQKKGISSYWVAKLVPEGLTDLKRKYGLKISPQEQPLTDDQLFDILDKTVLQCNEIPSWVKFRRLTKMAESTFIRRFGNKGKTEIYKHLLDWLKKNRPESKSIKLVNDYLENLGKDKTTTFQKITTKETKPPVWPKDRGRQYGSPIHFGNLIYEPTNEQGVVFLFGMISKMLGFSIEYIGTDFPDCEGKRYVAGKRKGMQQSVRIEFEYRSRDYDHPIEGCDVIVCWEDNWEDNCPLEVIELRSEIEKLRTLPEFKLR